MDVIKIKKSVNLKLATGNTGARRPMIRGGRKCAFTRLDLCCTIVAVTVLLGLAVLNLTGERGRIIQCTHNLKKLGQAMEEYAGNHGGGLPPASIEQAQATWDTLITPYLRPDLVISNSAYAKRQLKAAVAPRFFCPSDSLVRPHARTYAMSGHDMQPENWPPNPGNATGVGLVWDRWHMERLQAAGVWNPTQTNGNTSALVNLSWLPDPANTVLLTELVCSYNQIGNPRAATVTTTHQQLELFQGDPARFHHGRFNYLMADGHVELLSPFQTGNAGADNADQSASIWTIKAGD